jgi:hypothetical protein
MRAQALWVYCSFLGWQTREFQRCMRFLAAGQTTCRPYAQARQCVGVAVPDPESRLLLVGRAEHALRDCGILEAGTILKPGLFHVRPEVGIFWVLDGDNGIEMCGQPYGEVDGIPARRAKRTYFAGCEMLILGQKKSARTRKGKPINKCTWRVRVALR